VTDAAARRPGWPLDERASAGRENLDVDHVARYDAKEAWDASAEVRLLELLGLDAGSTVLDLGAGTGQFTLAVAPRCARVIAADVSQPMLERLRSKVAEAGFDNVKNRRSRLRFLRAQGRARRCRLLALRASSRARLLEGASPGAAGAMHASGRAASPLGHRLQLRPRRSRRAHRTWCASIPKAGEETDWVRADVEEHVRDEHSTFTWLLEPLLERSSFEIQATDYTDDGIFAKYLARRR